MTRFLAEQLSTAHWFDQRRTRAELAMDARGDASTRGSTPGGALLRASLIDSAHGQFAATIAAARLFISRW